ncbi:serine hydrolase domain-containing protein [Planomonospora venezuelensis]|uniref:D-alanyl-D-alanine carboxypeptidase n=1 Tax=Planomonospora venezuelensis TaxID=1999 RepID=A0A841D9T7_PLAVE|nr:serine hydrolase domain-containing protein [Planomonospora venezuelensis]MBB5964156.1 D-alanyl-D-alanine carboxypeptidase [Planomonospora venezuelensis]GIN01840.1 serine hydrolase [Planomonospora venezuelensis]
MNHPVSPRSAASRPSGAPAPQRGGRRLAALSAACAVTAVLAGSLMSPPASAAAPAAGAGGDAAAPGYGRAQLQRDVDALLKIGVIGVDAQVVTAGGGRLVATGGVADLRTRRPVPAGGYTRIASVTKTFVATVVLQLSEEGALSLDDTVERWLPGVVRGNGNDGRTITIRRLLQHTGGVPEAYPAFTTVEQYLKHRYDPFTPGQIVADAMKKKPDFAPGKGWLYSNTGYMLISMIIEKATGNPWHVEVRDRISRPLGLRHTRWSGTSVDVPSPHAKGYLVGVRNTPLDVTKHFDGDAAGGLISTTGDVNRFLRALAGGRLLPPALLEQMRATVPATAFEATWPGVRYGLGIMSRPLSCGGVYWNHGGDDLGYRTRVGVTADGRRSVVLAMSTQFGDARTQAQEKAAGDLVDRALCAAG